MRARLFVAIPLPEPIHGAIAEVQEEFRAALAREEIRWTNREQFHITLRFLGNVDSTRVRLLTDVLQQVLEPLPPLLMRGTGAGCFPNAKRPRVLWVGASDERRLLSEVHQVVQEATQPFTQEAAENRFSSHITLGRVRFMSRRGIGVLEGLLRKQAGVSSGEWTAGCVQLMESQLSSEGARHLVVERFRLAG